MNLTYADGNFILECPPRMRDFAKQIPGLKYKHKIDRYVGPASWTVANIINGVLVPRGLTYDSAVQNFITTEAARVQHIIQTKKEPSTLLVRSRSGKTLFPWQAADALAMANARASLDISDRGTGKGPKILGALRLLQRDVFPLLIVSRPLMLETLREETLEWIPELSAEDVVVIPKGLTPAKRVKLFDLNALVYIVPHHMLAMHSKIAAYGTNTLTKAQKTPGELNGRFRSAFIDEAHRLINPHNVSTRAAWAILDDLEYKYIATGSPISDAPDDLWSLLRAIRPDEFPSSTKFIERYCRMEERFFGGDVCTGLRPENEAEFRAIFDPLHVMRLKEDVLKDLPPKQYETVKSEMTGKQATVYKTFEEKGLVKVGDLIMSATNPMTKKLRLLQLSAGTPVLGTEMVPDGPEGDQMEIVKPVKLVMPSVKVDAMLETLENYPGQLIVWCESRLLLDLCAEQLEKADISFVEFRGGMKDKVREDGRHRFQAKDVRVALCMLQVASEGLTLTAASTALYLQRSDNMINATQSEDRNHRIGQTETVTIIDHITKDSEEDTVHANYLDKEGRSHDALGIVREQRAV